MKKISEIKVDPTNYYIDVRKNFKSTLSINKAKRIWIAIGNSITLKEIGKPYVINDTNLKIVTQLIKWAIMDPTYEKDLQKGIWIQGDVGTGKTLTLRILSEFMRQAHKVVLNYTAEDIVELYKMKPDEKLDNYTKVKDVQKRINELPLYIDDVGVEEFEVIHFGQKIHPIHSLFMVRHSTNKRMMFVSTNLGAEKIGNRYGARIRDRVREMFNVYPLKGESWRK